MTLFDKMVKITIITKNTIFCISYLGPNFFADSDPPMFSEAKTTNQSRTRAFRPASASHAHQPPPSSSEQSRVNIDHQLSRDSGDLVHPCNSFHPGQSVHGARLGLSAARPVQLPSVGPHQTVGEPVVCFKCKMCGFLCLSSTSLRHHLIDDHEETGLESDEASTSSTSWLPTALRAGIQLTCPVCPNTFNSGRSFKVHLSEDHGWDDVQADAEFGCRNDERREKAGEVMAEKSV